MTEKKSFFQHETAIVSEEAQIGKDTKVWHFCHVMKGAQLGEGCVLGQNVMVASDVKLGNHVKVQNNVSLYTGVVCEDHVFLGPSMVFTNVINPRSHVNRKAEFKETLVKQGATIGANATVICGNTIGQFAMIGAGAVITKDVDDFALVVGNPAKQIGWVSAHGERLEFDEEGNAKCPVTGELYQLKANQVTLIS